MVDSLERYLGEIESFIPLALSTLLDPRFKVLGFREEETANAAKGKLIEELQEQETPATSANIAPESQDVARASTRENRDDIWEDHDQNVQATRTDETAESDLLKEVRYYLSAPNQKRKEDPLLWWNKEGKSFPRVRKLALKYLTIPGMVLVKMPYIKRI